MSSEPQDVRLVMPDGTVRRPVEMRHHAPLDNVESWTAVFRPSDVADIDVKTAVLRADTPHEGRPVSISSILEWKIDE